MSKRNIDGFICLVIVPALQFEKFISKCWKCKYKSSKYLWVISKYHLTPPKTDESIIKLILVIDETSWATKGNDPKTKRKLNWSFEKQEDMIERAGLWSQ